MVIHKDSLCLSRHRLDKKAHVQTSDIHTSNVHTSKAHDADQDKEDEDNIQDNFKNSNNDYRQSFSKVFACTSLVFCLYLATTGWLWLAGSLRK